MMGVRTDDVVYCPLPLYHSVGGMVSLSGQFYKQLVEICDLILKLYF